MRCRFVMMLALAATLIANASSAATATSAAARRRASATTRPSVAARAASATSAGSKPADKPAATGHRTLQDIHIEGEIPVPQVLFVTARDQRRFLDFQHHHYLETCAQLGARTALPTRLAVTHGPDAPPKD